MRRGLYHQLGLIEEPRLKLYAGFGDSHQLHVYGHVLQVSAPLPVSGKNGIFQNILQLLRLFCVMPLKNIRVQLEWQGLKVSTTSSDDGFVKLEWEPLHPVQPGVYEVTVQAFNSDDVLLDTATASIQVPRDTQLAIVSDIDDTFLVSHSHTIWKRLYTLVTRNSGKRRPFENVAQHYRMLQYAQTTGAVPNPFFYVSSSEWNLYDYLVHFMQTHELPPGVMLLNQLRSLRHVLRSGQHHHSGKFVRIVRVLEVFETHRFVLLGDNSQRDPDIYSAVVEHFPERIAAVYIRMVRKGKKEPALALQAKLQALGIPCCLFRHSKEAMAHSRSIGLGGPEK
jgi:phosphatidate phosphatase APP1